MESALVMVLEKTLKLFSRSPSAHKVDKTKLLSHGL